MFTLISMLITTIIACYKGLLSICCINLVRGNKQDYTDNSTCLHGCLC